MALLIDTSVLIGMERRGWPPAALATLVEAEEEVLVSTVTISELLVGALRADTPRRRTEREFFIDRIIEASEIVSFDLAAARAHARLTVELSGSGQTIGANDVLIAAIALAGGHEILSEDSRHFERVPGLDVRRPAWP